VCAAVIHSELFKKVGNMYMSEITKSVKVETKFEGSLSKTLKLISLGQEYKNKMGYFTISSLSEPCATNI